MKMQLIRKDAIGLIYGIASVLLGFVIANLGYTNNSPFHMVIGSAWILIGLIAIGYIANHWFRTNTGKKGREPKKLN